MKGTSTSKQQVETLLMLGRLQALNQNPVANKSEIQKIIEGMARSFGKTEGYDFPGEVRAARAPVRAGRCVRLQRSNADRRPLRRLATPAQSTARRKAWTE